MKAARLAAVLPLVVDQQVVLALKKKEKNGSGIFRALIKIYALTIPLHPPASNLFMRKLCSAE